MTTTRMIRWNPEIGWGTVTWLLGGIVAGLLVVADLRAKDVELTESDRLTAVRLDATMARLDRGYAERTAFQAEMRQSIQQLIAQVAGLQAALDRGR